LLPAGTQRLRAPHDVVVISIAYRAATGRGLLVERDDRLQFWPFRVAGPVLLGVAEAEQSWRGATLAEALAKAADGGCLALAGASLDAVRAEVEEQLEAAR